MNPSRVKLTEEEKKINHKKAIAKYYNKNKHFKTLCDECLGSITFSNKYHHYNTDRHQKFLKYNKEKKLKEEEERKRLEEEKEKNIDIPEKKLIKLKNNNN